MKEKFQDFFEYNYTINTQLIEYLNEKFIEIPPKTLRLLNHLINAHQIWNARINNEREFEVWQINDWHILTKLNLSNYSKSKDILYKCNLNKIIQYTNSKGICFSNTIEDILFHVINHSTYHRAQIALDVKENGIEPLNTDYIFYKRDILI